MKCLCCGSERQERKACGYCGFKAPIAVGDEATSAMKDLVLEYRKSVLVRITQIYVQPFAYQLSKDGATPVAKPDHVIIAEGGEQCDGKIKWTEKLFAQNPDLDAARELTVYYVIDTEVKSVTASFAAKKLVRCSDFWQVGVAIDERLRLVVCIGDGDDPEAKMWAASDPVELELT